LFCYTFISVDYKGVCDQIGCTVVGVPLPLKKKKREMAPAVKAWFLTLLFVIEKTTALKQSFT
jgi:hypothetical protein